jgi:hypothetical protein
MATIYHNERSVNLRIVVPAAFITAMRTLKSLAKEHD